MKRRYMWRILLVLGAVAALLAVGFQQGRRTACPVEVRFLDYTGLAGQPTRFAVFLVTNQSEARFKLEWYAVPEASAEFPAATSGVGAGRDALSDREARRFLVLPPDPSRPWRLEVRASGHASEWARWRQRCAWRCANWRLGRLTAWIAPGAPDEFTLPPVPVPPAP